MQNASQLTFEHKNKIKYATAHDLGLSRLASVRSCLRDISVDAHACEQHVDKHCANLASFCVAAVNFVCIVALLQAVRLFQDCIVDHSRDACELGDLGRARCSLLSKTRS